MAKKFSFSLQKLLNYKEQLFDIERTILTEMNAELSRLHSELSRFYREHREKSQDLVLKSAEGISPFEMMSHKNYLVMIEDSIEEKLKQIEMQQQVIDKQMDKVREAKMEISTMEKLKEKKLEEYTYKDNKAQEQFIEEFVNHTKSVADAS
jgi:flagellar FliJ protein